MVVRGDITYFSTALEERDVVERIGIDAERLPLRLDADDRPRVDAIAPLVDVLHGRGKLLGQHACQKAEPPHVDAEHRDLLLADTTRRLEHRAVTTQGEGEVGLEVAAIDQLVDIQPV